MGIPVYVVVRTLHVLVAALWVGSGVFLAAFLMPTIRRLGPQAAPVSEGIAQRGMGLFLELTGGVTILSGLWLYWEFTQGLDPAISFSAPGITFGLGGLFGIAASIVGGGIIGRSVKRARQLGATVAVMADGPEKSAHVATMARLRRRVALATRCDAILLVVALILMALGHYV